MNANPSVTMQYIRDLRELGGLKGTDVANIVDVSKATVSRWENGSSLPQPSAEMVLADLHYVVRRLDSYYSSDEVRSWLLARHPQLEDRRAIDLINRGETEEVLAIINRLDSEAYV
ncbi:helix-turn-helix domain-containing protein [Minwuia sp.]|uniref:helix-turn-helix domain-containing protein n=1 Tax=Minwuia sp. TaxID=2493630 RepID=UPI003A938075